jgi:hypothetical protein
VRDSATAPSELPLRIEGRPAARDDAITSILRRKVASVFSPLMAANATFALEAGVWVRRVRLLIVSPDLTGTTCPQPGRNSTYPLVQISEAGSVGHEPDSAIVK